MYMAALTQFYWLNFAAITTYVEETLNISAMQVGWLANVAPLTIILLSIPAGMVIDKKGFKYGVGIGAIFVSISAALRIINPYSFIFLLICQIGMSIGTPFVLNGVTKLATTWFPKKEEATAVGLGSLSLFVGMAVALGATPFLVESIGYTTTLLIYGVMGIIGGLTFLTLVRSKPPTPARELEEAREEVSFWEGVKRILKIRDFLLLGFIAFIGIGAFNSIATWIEKILNEAHNISMTNAGTISALLIFSGIVGCIVIPIISDKIMKRKPFVMIASLVGIISLTVLIFADSYIANASNAVIMGFFVLSSLPIILTMSTELTGEKYAGISVAYIMLLGNAATTAIVPIMEFLHGRTGNYVLSLSFLVALFGIGFIMCILIRETFKTTGIKNTT